MKTFFPYDHYNSALPAVYFLLATVFFLTLTGCLMSKDEEGPSTVLKALEKIIDINIAAIEGRYKIFSTPESSGMVSGPTGYMILVAEITSPNDVESSSTSLGQTINRYNFSSVWYKFNIHQFQLKQVTNSSTFIRSLIRPGPALNRN